MLPCLFCGGDASASDHLLHCDGRQGVTEDQAWKLAQAQEQELAAETERHLLLRAITEPAILNAALGEKLREIGIANVDAGTPEPFKDRALHAVWMAAQAHAEFTSDAVWLELGEAGQWHAERRALGPVMRVAATAYKWIEPTDRFVLTAQPLRHRAPVRVWRSLIHAATRINEG